jgi:hypothetical protein
LAAKAGLQVSPAFGTVALQDLSVPAFGRAQVDFALKAPSTAGRYTIAATVVDARGVATSIGIAHDVSIL